MLTVRVTGVEETLSALRDLAHEIPTEKRIAAPRKMSARGRPARHLPEYWVAASHVELQELGVVAFEAEIVGLVNRQGLG